MALLEEHFELATTLHGDMRQAHQVGEWPIVVDAGFYAVFHALEAMSALECRDSYSFADALDIIETVIAERAVAAHLVSDYRYLLYFRRGALYGAHFPTAEQLTDYVEKVERNFMAIQSYLAAHGGLRTPSSERKGTLS